MICDGYTKIWDLEVDELVRLDGARGVTLRVTRGVLWVTFEDDTRDVVLTAGDVFTIDRGGLTLVEAQGKATVCVMGRPIEEVHVRAHQPALHERARGWLPQIGDDLVHRFVPYF